MARSALWRFGIDNGYTEQVSIDNVEDTPTLTLQGSKDLNGKSGVPYTDQAGTYHPAGRAGAWDNVVGLSEIIITVNTTGWRDLTLRWDYFSDNTIDDLGPSGFDMDYRIGAGAWVEIRNNAAFARDGAWHEFSQNLITGIENKPLVQFRINDLSQGDESGGNFKVDNFQLTGTTVVASYITLLTPNGGENLMTGEVFNIRWMTTGGTVDSVKLEYSVNNGVGWTEIDTVANTGLYAWEIPDANSLDCLVRATNAVNQQVSDISDTNFRIFRCLLNFDLNGDCYIDMRDLALLASEWLLCGDVLDPRCH